MCVQKRKKEQTGRREDREEGRSDGAGKEGAGDLVGAVLKGKDGLECLVHDVRVCCGTVELLQPQHCLLQCAHIYHLLVFVSPTVHVSTTGVYKRMQGGTDAAVGDREGRLEKKKKRDETLSTVSPSQAPPTKASRN